MHLKQFVAAAALMACAQAGAQPPKCGPYRVAFYESGLLYFKGKSGAHAGIDLAVLDEVARRTGCVFERFLDSRVRTWTALASGRLDMTVSGIETAERRAFAVFVPYILNNRNYMIVHNALAKRVASLRDFQRDRSLRLGVVKGFVHGEVLDACISELKAQGRVVELADLETVARVFAAGRIEAFLTQPAVWPPLLERNHLTGTVQPIDVAPTDSAVLGLVLSRSRVAAADVEIIRSAIETMRRDGTLEEIFSRYVGPDMGRTLAGRRAERPRVLSPG